MGYMTELNTLLGLPKEFPIKSLEINKTYSVLKEKERTFPLHIAILIIDKDWNFYGYAAVNSIIIKEGKSTLEFSVLYLFSSEEQKLYKEKFIEAGKKTGEVK